MRPSGANDAYPPISSSGPPDGFTIALNLGADGILNVNVNVTTINQAPSTTYNRMLGSMVASIDGGEMMTDGVALFEEFKLV